MTDRLLTEVERQQKYLARLPENFTFPLFNARQALESQRRSGYRDTASAAREIVDNAIEAGAKRIDIIFERPKQLKKNQRQESISSVAFIDNGAGMLPKMARYALSWGAGTHFDEPDFIGKFGFGLPNASINQTRLVEVYTKTADASVISKATLDIQKVQQFDATTIAEPATADLPDFVQRHLKDKGLTFDHGTVVVWVKPDRLSLRSPANMREHLVDDFGVTYRYMLPDIELYVEQTKVEATDPLFLDPKARLFLPQDHGGAEMTIERHLAVKYVRDDETGALHLQKIADISELDPKDPNLITSGVIHIRVSRFPKGFAAEGKDASPEARKRLDIRKSRRGMSFVRANREIETVDVFPKSARDAARGLGDWPMLQTYAYHWGVEIRFDPKLDDVFGITNDKQTVRPIEDFWRVLVGDKLDESLQAENNWQRTHRQKEKKPETSKSPEPSAAERAAASADTAGGKRPRVPEHDKPEIREDLEKAAKARVGVTAKDIEEAKQAIEHEAKRRPYQIDFFEDARAPFYEPSWVNGSSVTVKINRAHPFFTTLYARLLLPEADKQAKEAVDVLLIALARAELTVDDEQAATFYQAQRERAWSTFLNDALRVLAQTLQPDDEEASEPMRTAAE
ncbi:MAG: hypothetical protein QOI12_3659 [Alphaproteobacteria bacterium]|jgi:hypothetical protein|nr:hypothetical protein [Alphaproteobacteria bacterium]